MNELEFLVGKRLGSLDELKEFANKKSTLKIINIIESESEIDFKECDFALDYELENDDDIYTMWYLKDNAGQYYITEV